MVKEATRREFLKSSALGIAAVTAGAIPLAAAENRDGNEIKTWVTDDTHRPSPGDNLRWRSAGKVAPDIELYPEKKYQPVLGFGAAFTKSACYMFNQLTPAAREKVLHELFHPSEMRLSVCRTCIGSSDYSTKAHTYDEGDPDPELKRFSIEQDRQYILPILREARKLNPDLFLFSSPWSPPGWMKAGGSMLGGSMRTIHSETGEITRSGQYWALAHFSRAVDRGALRFSEPDVHDVAFENPAGNKVLILTNAGDAQTTMLRLGTWECGARLPKNSLTTLTWS